MRDARSISTSERVKERDPFAYKKALTASLRYLEAAVSSFEET